MGINSTRTGPEREVKRKKIALCQREKNRVVFFFCCSLFILLMQIPRQLASSKSRAQLNPAVCSLWSPPGPAAPPPTNTTPPGTVEHRDQTGTQEALVSLHPKFKALTGREPQMVSSIRGQDLLTLSSQQPLPAHKQPQC